MPVKTKKEREEEFTSSSPKIKIKEDTKEDKKEDKKDKVKMYLPQITNKGDYNLIIKYKGKKEKIRSKNGVIAVAKEEVEKYESCGFKPIEQRVNKFHTYYCEEYADNSFDLPLDDGTKLKVEKGIAIPKNKYEENQLLKNHFKIYKLKK